MLLTAWLQLYFLRTLWRLRPYRKTRNLETHFSSLPFCITLYFAKMHSQPPLSGTRLALSRTDSCEPPRFKPSHESRRHTPTKPSTYELRRRIRFVYQHAGRFGSGLRAVQVGDIVYAHGRTTVLCPSCSKVFYHIPEFAEHVSQQCTTVLQPWFHRTHIVKHWHHALLSWGLMQLCRLLMRAAIIRGGTDCTICMFRLFYTITDAMVGTSLALFRFWKYRFFVVKCCLQVL